MNFWPRGIILMFKYYGIDNVYYTLNFGLGIARRTKSINTARKIMSKEVK